MQYKRLGRTGLKVSNICLGTMQFGWTADESTSFEIMDRAVELGCNFFDSADIYSHWVDGNDGGVSETIIGNWLAETSVRRDELVVATKVRGQRSKSPLNQGLSRQHILYSAEASLRRLQTDYIDLYQVHWPDEETPLDETLSALTDLVRSGKVRYIGCSNYPAWLLAKSLWISDVKNLARFDSLQPHYSLVHRAEFERELQPLCLDQGVGVIPYSPLGGGFLTGKYRRDSDLPESQRAGRIREQYMNDTGFAAIDKLEEIGRNHDATIAQTAIAWVLANPAVSSAIIGANNLTQLEDTVKGADIVISADQKTELDTITTWQ
jgi:aryl-alcohol dehydrogenase-like predicted oxidoreductase